MSDSVEDWVRAQIGRLERDAEAERKALRMWLGERPLDSESLRHFGPYRMYGVSTERIDAITIQIGTLYQVLHALLERPKPAKSPSKRVKVKGK